MSRVACVTGANRGIGLELSKQLSQGGYQVYALCRQASDALQQISSISIITGVDVSSWEAIHNAYQKLKDQIPSVDLLINNAAIYQSIALENLNPSAIQDIKDQFYTNALGPLMLTAAFSPLLKRGSKVILISSRMGSIADNSSGGHYGYRMSKSALNAAGKSMAIDFKEKGIAVGILHPGWIKTQMTGYIGNDTPPLAAQQLIERIDNLNLDNTGTFWHAQGQTLLW